MLMPLPRGVGAQLRVRTTAPATAGELCRGYKTSWNQGIPSSLFAGHHHLRDDRRIHRRRLHSRGHHHRRAVSVRAGEPHSRSMAGLQQFGH